MHRIILVVISTIFYSCPSNSIHYYIARHTEKAAVDSTVKTSDAPLSDQGIKRAESLMRELKKRR